MSLKHLVASQSKEVVTHTYWWKYVKGAQELTERVSSGQSDITSATK